MIRLVGMAVFVAGIGLGVAPVPSAGPVYDNCTEAHDDGVWDIPESDDAYWSGGDRDDDGIACESYAG